MDYDLIIIGAGPGGYTAAARAGALGWRVLLVEKKHLGGTCLNAGCIPTKALLATAKLVGQLHHAESYGVAVQNVVVDLAAAMARKNAIVEKLRDGVAYQMQRHEIAVMTGEAVFIDRQTVALGGETYRAPHIIIATGAVPQMPTIPGIDHALTTDAALNLSTLPQQVAILGSGELVFAFATIWAALGTRVTVLGQTDDLLPAIDADVTEIALANLGEMGVKFHWDVQVGAIKPTRVIGTHADGSGLTLDVDSVINVWGRVPNVRGLGLENLDLDYDARGIRVNEHMQTNLPGIYALGDVTGRSMWAATAIRAADVAINHMAGVADRMRYHAIPTVLYTIPETASVGLTEAQATTQNIPFKTVKLPMKFNGRFLTESEGKRGLCKVVVHAQTNALLGVHLMGGNASELIYGAAAMLEDEFRIDEVKEVVFAHPTMSELFKDALYEL